MLSEEGVAEEISMSTAALHNKKPCLIILLLLSEKYPPVHINGTL